MENFGRMMLVFGALLLVGGAVILLLARLNIPFGRLPGDIHIQGQNSSIYIPITSSILASLVLSVLLNLIGRFWGK